MAVASVTLGTKTARARTFRDKKSENKNFVSSVAGIIKKLIDNHRYHANGLVNARKREIIESKNRNKPPTSANVRRAGERKRRSTTFSPSARRAEREPRQSPGQPGTNPPPGR
jgi:predicted RNA-binding protein